MKDKTKKPKIILGIETSSKNFSLALAEDGKVCGTYSLDCGFTHSRYLVKSIDCILRKKGIRLKQLDSIAVDVGPGSFTGVRVGVSAARVLAQAAGLGLSGVSSLKSLAHRSGSWDGFIVPVIPAVRGEVYCAVYDNRSFKLKNTCAGSVVAVEDIGLYLKRHLSGKGPLLICGSAAENIRHDASGVTGGLGRLVSFSDIYPLAEDVALLGWEALKKTRGSIRSWEKVVPDYIKKPQAVRRFEAARKPQILGGR